MCFFYVGGLGCGDGMGFVSFHESDLVVKANFSSLVFHA